MIYTRHHYESSNLANLTANEAKSDAREAKTEIASLQFEVERLLMITEALWTILQERLGVDESDLIRRIAEIDLQDGRLDGKVGASPPGNCPHCQRKLARKRPCCIYCGKPVRVDPFER